MIRHQMYMMIMAEHLFRLVYSNLHTSFTLSVSDNELDGEFKILNKGNNQFEVSLANTNSFEDLNLDVYNMVGQRLLWKTVKNTSGFYSHTLDMSYASKGIYLVRLRDNKSSSVKRIVVE